MSKHDSNNRRSALKQMGAIFLGLFSWSGVEAASRKVGAGTFAGMFLQDGNPVQVPPGYYDPNSQLYRDSQTHQPMFVAQADGEKKVLSEKELANLLNNGHFVDMKEAQKFKALSGWGTASTQTTLSTTQCCPIVTDSERDRGVDDTPDPPPN